MNTTIHRTDSGNSYTIRPVNTWRDLPTIIDLIELGFEQELDPQGWKIIQQTRMMLRRNAVSRLILGSSADASGFVCEKDGEVVGNLSLRRASPAGMGRMIGNVVVVPEHRGQGLAKVLMERAIKVARRQSAGWIGLEVREGNAPAMHIYEQLGFRAVGRTLHYLRPADIPWPMSHRPGAYWRPSKPADSKHWLRLAHACFSASQRDILEIRSSAYRYGDLERQISLRLMRQIERAWLYEDSGVQIALHIKTDKQYHFHVWDILMHRQFGEVMAQKAMNKALNYTRRFPAWPVIALIADHPALGQCLEARGFHLHRTLVQMKLML